MKETAPEKLFVCLYKSDTPMMQEVASTYEGKPMTPEMKTLREKHMRYVYDHAEKGIIWAIGPSTDWTRGMAVFAVDSMEEARRTMREDPFYAGGVFYDDTYFEWIVHAPLSKASTAHKAHLQRRFKDMGILTD